MVSKRKIIEQEHDGKPIKEILTKLFDENSFSKLGDAAAALNISQPTISQWIDRSGLRIRVVLAEQEHAS